MISHRVVQPCGKYVGVFQRLNVTAVKQSQSTLFKIGFTGFLASTAPSPHSSSMSLDSSSGVSGCDV